MAPVGIDIGGTSIKAVRVDSGRTDARVPHDGVTVDSLREAISAAADAVWPDHRDCLGVCLPGLIDESTGRVSRCSNLQHIIGMEPKAIVEAATGIRPAVFSTDAAAWGIGVWRTERVPGRLLVLAMGTGIGASLIVNGQPRTLDGITPGHVGMIDVSIGEPDPPLAGDGTPGVLEAYAGGRALTARFAGMPLAEAIAKMDADDPALRALAKAVRICHAIYKPDAVRLVGGIGALFAGKIQLLEDMVRVDLTTVASDNWTIATSDDQFLAAEGVALLAQDSAEHGT